MVGDIWSDLTKFWGPMVWILTKNSSEKWKAPQMPGVPPPPLGLNIDRCITAAVRLQLNSWDYFNNLKLNNTTSGYSLGSLTFSKTASLCYWLNLVVIEFSRKVTFLPGNISRLTPALNLLSSTRVPTRQNGHQNQSDKCLIYFKVCQYSKLNDKGCSDFGCVSLRKSKIGFLNPKQSENGFCISFLDRSI